MKLEIDKQLASKRYIRQTVQIVFALFSLELLVLQLVGSELLLTPILVSVGFALLVESGNALLWKRLESKEDESKATFFMAVSGFRFLLALLVLFIYYLNTDRGGMAAFLLLFAPFYLAVLAHHSLFFSHLRNNK